MSGGSRLSHRTLVSVKKIYIKMLINFNLQFHVRDFEVFPEIFLRVPAEINVIFFKKRVNG